MQLWQRKAQSPGTNDLISIMLQSDAMSHMSENEFLGNLILLIVGGNDTTHNSMSAYAWGLHQYPEQRAIFEQNHAPDLAVNAMHELVRWQTPLSHMPEPRREPVSRRRPYPRRTRKRAASFVFRLRHPPLRRRAGG
jgi:cytochrome P450